MATQPNKPVKPVEPEFEELNFEPERPIDPELDKKADEFLTQLLSDETASNTKRRAVDEMGTRTQQEITNLSKMLEGPIKTLAETGDNGGPVAKSLIDLKEQVEDLDPAKFDFSSPSGFMASFGKMLPGKKNRMGRYFAKYQSAEAVIDQIIKSLELGRDQLRRDNITLSHDRDRMVTAMDRLERTIQLGQLLDDKLQYKLDRDLASDADQHRFVQEELLFPLRQRIIDLQQTLNINQQGILTIEVIIRNNRELMRGVGRALNVTVTALQTAIATALALNNQEIVMKKINALNDTTSKLIAHNAERLKTQGAAIHKQASESMLSMEQLEKAFQDIRTALEDISKFRQEALPKMATQISRMDELNKEAADTLRRMARGNQAQTEMIIDLDADQYEVGK
ncbi:Uncharacterized conserved protein YaaN involved in tellurite resistance [Catalinimonas alkaloidigena]|uniref:Uncharacterized conserved protein YaaN involved in tellurite resistance n=1 Tax=Catalinimonas alkaloidigena TaxID=1075417 RepID=A0A1G9EB86_9BACT|nr:toxic anion resistance protein [Catalinimonas alkaloidigena]SDK73432.1 Uncharacterized conserved protein YaaN involved in tellurite resistance [Catalinimonas alkaloidigena]